VDEKKKKKRKNRKIRERERAAAQPYHNSIIWEGSSTASQGMPEIPATEGTSTVVNMCCETEGKGGQTG
jgi:hypothetical protein